MSYLSKAILFLFIICSAYSQARAQQQQSQPKSTFDAHQLFSPLFMEGETNAFHSATGKPGPKYWQNRADYNIQATLDTTQKKINGKVTITYTNNSPYNLHFVWLQLDQNAFRKNSLGTAQIPVTGSREQVDTYTNGYNLKSVSIKLDGKKYKANYLVNDTRMQIRLPKALKKKGKKMKIFINYSFEIPTHGKDRMGRINTKNGRIYSIAQWYPRMEVYDEVEGWNNLPYLGAGEFYLEYGNFNYSVTAPSNMLVVGSGKLQNPREVLSQKERDQLKKARKSDKTVMIRSKQDVQNGQPAHPGKKMLTWHFKMNQARDVSWAASKAFMWDGARINLPHGKTALAQSVYPVESAADSAWGRDTQFIKGAIQLYSKHWYPYPYPVATAVAGNVNGMEYPGIVFENYKSKGAGLWGVTNHEFGHTWFPMIVGSNERKYAWMDEGFNTFMNQVDTKKFNNGEFYHKRDHQRMASYIFGSNSEPIFTRPDVIKEQDLGITAYSKPALALQVLRNDVLGKKRFDYAFRRYIRRWAYKHPTPWDFFNTMSNAGGEDLHWFWKEWFMHDWKLDQGIKNVRYVNGNPKNGAYITIVNYDKMAMPVTIRITQKNGKTGIKKLPVEIWQRGPTWTFKYPSTSKIVKAQLNPNHSLPDVNPKNNSWQKKVMKPAPKGENAQNVFDKYIQAIGGKNKLASVHDIKLNMNAQIQGHTLNITEMKKLPDKYSLAIKVASSGQTVQSIKVNGDSVHVQGPQGNVSNLSDQERKMLQQRAIIFPELKYGTKGYQAKLQGIQQGGQQDEYVVKVTDPAGVKKTIHYAVDSGLKTEVQIGSGQNASTVKYSNYKQVDGVKIPFTIITHRGVSLTEKVKNAKINSGLKDSKFE